MNHSFFPLLIALLLTADVAQAQTKTRPIPSPEPPRPDMLVGAYYRDAEGWTRSGTTELGAAWGALTTTTTTGDPQLTSPVTYLRCADYERLYLRMRATPPSGAPAQAAGQLFWSTVEHAPGEKASVTFAVSLDGRWHDYDLRLKAAPGWDGLLDRLRLDPVDVSGVKIEIDEIRLDKG